MIENAVETHQDQGVLPHPDHGLLRGCDFSKKKYQERTCNRGNRKPEEIAMRGEYDHYGIIIVEVERSGVQFVGEQDNKEGYDHIRRQYFQGYLLHEEFPAPQIDAHQIKSIHGNRFMDKEIIPSDDPSFERVKYIQFQIEPVSHHVEYNGADQDFRIGL